MKVQSLLTGFLLLLGAGFFVANVKLVVDYTRYQRRRPTALLTWPSQKPPYYTLELAIGVVLGFLILLKIFRLHMQA
ncbi:MAG: hypothetical protein DMG03_08600 [Acidobacteria bacterium]|nr:MAG: hypothetical protein DMG03_08600 [Acidobacteriota bacterium]